MRLFVLLLAFLCSAPAASARDLDPLAIAEALERAFVDVAERAGPGVVTLELSGSIAGNSSRDELRADGVGSGFIVNANGLVYTNHHVVENASTIEVVMRDGRRFKADKVGSDPLSDIGVVRILDPPDDLPVVEFGDSDAVRVGQYAIAIGSPFGIDYADTFTVGHVSGKGRNRLGRGPGGRVIPGFGRLEDQDFIQVDTLIKPGNSGGPLLDIQGRVIGVNTIILGLGAEGAAAGLGFAVPINLAREVATQLVSTGRVVRGWVGVRVATPDPDVLRISGAPALAGAMVNEVLEGGPAAQGGLEEGDLVLQVGDRVIRTQEDFRGAVVRSPVGEPLAVRVWRDGRSPKELTLTLAPAERPVRTPSPEEPPTNSAAEDDDRVPKAGRTAYLERRVGIRLETLDRRLNRRLGRKARAPGVHVLSVVEGSPAARAGLQVGDVIVEVDHRGVENPGDVAAGLRGAGRSLVPLLVERDGKRTGFAIEQP